MPKFRDASDINARIYPRDRNGVVRYYADFRDYVDVGGKLEAMHAPGEPFATTNPDAARAAADVRLKQLQTLRQIAPAPSPGTTRPPRTLKAFAAFHLTTKAINREADEQWLATTELHLKTACAFFGETTDLAAIAVADVTQYVKELSETSNGRGGTLSSGTINQMLNSLSNLFRRAISLSLVPVNGNPVKGLSGRPKIERLETPFLEITEVADMLARAKQLVAKCDDLAYPFFYEMLATYFYTGMREDELLGLRRHEVFLERDIFDLKPNEWRRLKTKDSKRPVRIVPEYRPILMAYLNGPHQPTGDLVFPGSDKEGGEQMITDLRKMLDKLPLPARLERRRTPAELAAALKARDEDIAAWKTRRRGPKPTRSLEELEREIVSERCVPPMRTKIARHTFCAARLQTLDRGEPISLYTVAKELGHKNTTMVEEVYGHLGTIRYRGEHVSYIAAAAEIRAERARATAEAALHDPEAGPAV